MTLKDTAECAFDFMTDKRDEAHSFAGQSYLDVYEKLFGHWKNDAMSILEIGVCQGFSLCLWREYFTNAKIFGIDIDPDSDSRELLANRDVNVRIVDQGDLQALDEFARASGPFRVIIDDGSHIVDHVVTSFEALWPFVEPGGYYVVEDTSCLYYGADLGWPGMSHNKEGTVYDNDRSTLDRILLGLIKELDHRKGDIRSIQFFAQQIVFQKV